MVAAIGVAQEFQRVFTGTTYHRDADGGGVPRFGYHKADRRVSAYYFYVVDEVFGPAFVKLCAYFPYTAKLCLLWRRLHKIHYASSLVMSRGSSVADRGSRHRPGG